MDKKTFFIVIIISLGIITSIGLALSAYNYYLFDKPFLNDITRGLLATFVMGILISIIGLAEANG